MEPCPYLDRAIYYRVEDIPSACSIGSQLANILEQLYKTGGLSKTILKLLENQGLVALNRLAAKDISYTEYLNLAEQEQQKRRLKHLDIKYKPPFYQIGKSTNITVARANAKESPQQRQIKEDVMKTNYVLIDFENVQPESLAMLNREHFHVMIFTGATQKKVSIKLAKAIHEMGKNAEYIEISGKGNNALDFHIAYYIGQLAAKEPTAYFHIISKDTGFDPLISYLKTKKISAARETDIGEIPLVKAPPLAPPLPVVQQPVPPPQLIVRPPEPLRLKHSHKPPQPATRVATSAPAHKTKERLSGILQNLRLLKAAKPRTVKTLTSHIKTIFHNAITDGEIAALIAELRTKKYISVTENRITYNV
jgi:hypothetical protein